MPFDPRRTMAMARKEVRHIVRDPFTLALALGLPLVMVWFFGWVMDLDVRDIRIAVVDRDRTRASRELAGMFSASGYFRLVPPEDGDFLGMLDADKVKGVVVIEPGFGRDAGAGRTARAQVLLDGTDNSTAGVLAGYVAGIQLAATARLTGGSSPPPARLVTRFLFNPELNSRWFIVPGLLVVVMGVMTVLLTALTVAREWETGSMELLLSTPVRPAEIILGKLGPYLLLALAAVAFVYVMARGAFGVPFRGSHPLFLLGCLLFLIPSLAQGLLISVVTRSQALAMQVAAIAGLLPPMLLSGFIFPNESMPVFFRWFTMLLPPRWFVEISRGIFLRDASLVELARPFLALAILSAVLVGASVRRFKADLEP
jgi:ABC-2 type transport system permease protein